MKCARLINFLIINAGAAISAEGYSKLFNGTIFIEYLGVENTCTNYKEFGLEVQACRINNTKEQYEKFVKTIKFPEQNRRVLFVGSGLGLRDKDQKVTLAIKSRGRKFFEIQTKNDFKKTLWEPQATPVIVKISKQVDYNSPKKETSLTFYFTPIKENTKYFSCNDQYDPDIVETVSCPSNCTSSVADVYGVVNSADRRWILFTQESSVCKAAIAQGVIGDSGGEVQLMPIERKWSDAYYHYVQANQILGKTALQKTHFFKFKKTVDLDKCNQVLNSSDFNISISNKGDYVDQNGVIQWTIHKNSQPTAWMNITFNNIIDLKALTIVRFMKHKNSIFTRKFSLEIWDELTYGWINGGTYGSNHHYQADLESLLTEKLTKEVNVRFDMVRPVITSKIRISFDKAEGSGFQLTLTGCLDYNSNNGKTNRVQILQYAVIGGAILVIFIVTVICVFISKNRTTNEKNSNIQCYPKDGNYQQVFRQPNVSDHHYSDIDEPGILPPLFNLAPDSSKRFRNYQEVHTNKPRYGPPTRNSRNQTGLQNRDHVYNSMVSSTLVRDGEYSQLNFD